MAKDFQDTKDRPWSLAVNNATIDQVKEIEYKGEPVDLLGILEEGNPLLSALGTNPYLLCNVMYHLVKDQCDAKDVTARDFAEAFGGDKAAEVAPLFLEELLNFFLPRQRRALKALIAATVEAEEENTKFIEAKAGPGLQAIMRHEHQKIEKRLALLASDSGSESESLPGKQE